MYLCIDFERIVSAFDISTYLYEKRSIRNRLLTFSRAVLLVNLIHDTEMELCSVLPTIGKFVRVGHVQIQREVLAIVSSRKEEHTPVRFSKVRVHASDFRSRKDFHQATRKLVSFFSFSFVSIALVFRFASRTSCIHQLRKVQNRSFSPFLLRILPLST